MDLDAGSKPSRMREQSRGERMTVGPQIVRHEMGPNRVDSRIRDERLELRATRWIVAHDDVDVLAKAPECGRDLRDPTERRGEPHGDGSAPMMPHPPAE